MMERKKVLLIGANGNLGKMLTVYLLKKFEVHCLLRSGPKFGINSIFLKFIEGDALNEESLSNALEEKDYVVSCFAPRPQQSLENNIQYSKLLATLLPKKKIQKFVGVYHFMSLKGCNSSQKEVTVGELGLKLGKNHKICIQILRNSLKEVNRSGLALCVWPFGEGKEDKKLTIFDQDKEVDEMEVKQTDKISLCSLIVEQLETGIGSSMLEVWGVHND